MLERRYDGWRAYAQSKRAQVMFTFELAERLRSTGAEGVTVNALHPATFMTTKMVLESVGHAASTVEDGVEATLRLALSAELYGITGRYFDRMREAQAEDQAYDPHACGRLWSLSEELAGGRPRDQGASLVGRSTPARIPLRS